MSAIEHISKCAHISKEDMSDWLVKTDGYTQRNQMRKTTRGRRITRRYRGPELFLTAWNLREWQVLPDPPPASGGALASEGSGLEFG